MENRFDIFEPGDLSALVCIDVPELQRLVLDQLAALGYKIHTGLFVEDILLKLRAHVYDVLIVSENFSATDMQSNPIVAEATSAPAAQRRRQLIVVVGSSFVTNDEMQAFEHSVDLVVGLADAVNLRPVVRRAVQRIQGFYAPFSEAQIAAGVA